MVERPSQFNGKARASRLETVTNGKKRDAAITATAANPGATTIWTPAGTITATMAIIRTAAGSMGRLHPIAMVVRTSNWVIGLGR